MAPRTDSHRLAAIVPEQLARETTERVLHGLGRYVAPLSPGVTLVLDTRGGVQASGLYLSILDLCAWAQRGAGEPEEIPDLTQTIAEAVYPPPLDGSQINRALIDVWSSEADPATPIGLVLFAAKARLHLADNAAISARQLGALGGCTQDHVRLLVRRGEIAGTRTGRDVMIRASAARRWLRAREVPGFSAPPRSP